MQNEFQKELIDFAYRNLKISLVGLYISSLIIFVIYENYLPFKTLLLFWIVSITIVTILRFYSYFRYIRYKPSRTLNEWQRIFFILLLPSTILWAMGAVFAFWIDQIVPLSLLAAIYAGVSAGGILSLAPFLRAAVFFLTVPLLTLTIVLLLKQNIFAYELAFLLACYYLFILFITKKLHRQFLRILIANKKYYLEKKIATQTQDRLKAVFEHTPVGILFYDHHYNIIDANPTFFKLLDLDPETKQLPPDIRSLFSVDEEREKYTKYHDKHLKIHTSPIQEQNSIAGAVGIIHDVTDEQNLLEKTKYQAKYDHLTNIPNRSTLFETIAAHLQKIKEANRYFAVLFVDLDDFKNINDSLGHHAGDMILIEISHRLKKALRKRDFIARLGGDEFVIIISDLSPNLEESTQLVTKVTKRLHQVVSTPIELDNLTLQLSSSIGVVIVQDHLDPYEIVKFADIAMYQAKKEGKNQTRFFQKEMDEWIKRRLQVENAIKNAKKNRELELHFQPIVDLSSDTTKGLEALVRWKNEKFRSTSVEEFIHIAEECGAIHEIGEWIIKEAFKTFAKLQDRFPLDKIAINISIKQFNEPDFIRKITQYAKHYEVPFDKIELEITESIFINNKETAKLIMQNLRDLGFSISIDDFGTGFSSLSYLKYLPFTTLKIDKSFLKEIPTNEEDMALAETIVAIAKRFDLQTIAEGIETELQKEYIRSIGCDFYQGYIKSKPLQYNELVTFLKREFS